MQWKRKFCLCKELFYLLTEYLKVQVYKSKCLINEQYYALKIVPKYNIKTYGRLNSLLNEPHILKRVKVNNNFIPEIISSFEDYENIYLITTFYDGPNLGYFKSEVLSEEQIKFIIACIIQSLKDIRKYEIIHRDLNYLNVIKDKNNYFNLIDFSFSVDYDKRKLKKLKCNNGDIDTPPEIRKNSDYSYNSDYYRLGQLILFLIYKKYPLNLEQIEKNKLNRNYSTQLYDFVRVTTIENTKERLGYKNIAELMNHCWFVGFNWKKLEKKQIISPFNKNEFKINRSICSKFNKNLIDVRKYLIIKNQYMLL